MTGVLSALLERVEAISGVNKADITSVQLFGGASR